VELYDPQQEITALSMRQRLTATALREAVDNGALTLTWQRVMPLPDTDGPPLYAEVQSHLPRSDGGLMPAELFLPVARRHGLMALLDRRVMQRATDAWLRLGRALPLALNLSRETLCDAGMVEGVHGLMTARGVRHGELWFEIRESAWEARLAEARAVAGQLRELGCRLVLDDCSGSFACLDHLEKGGFSALKVDVRKLGPLRANGSGLAMFKALITAAHDLGVTVIAQKLPDRGVLSILAAVGVDGVQARLVAPPELLVA
jgi:EAL domain-containing protein (putative c-di-GMP-specific phosphodiesterase class I)